MAVTGASPVSFVSESTNPGKQYFIPLSAITIANGAATATGWISATSLNATDGTLVGKVLATWLAQGLIATPPT